MLEEYAEAVRKGHRLFLSYCWSDFEDGGVWLEELTRTLVENTVSYWWDQSHMPQKDLKQFEELLEGILHDGIRQAAFLVALMRPGYVESGPDAWVRKEWNQAGEEIERDGRRHRMTRVAVVFGDQPAAGEWMRPDDIPLSVARDEPAADVAQLLISTVAAAALNTSVL
ncbi:TIR domain-containing protein [Rhodococcus opacus]|nr:TIR domain-containing protein [Rhodococcus opacus]